VTPPESQVKPIGWTIVAAASAAAIFTLDLVTPLGVAVSMLYVLPLVITWFVPGWWSTGFMTGIVLVLTWVGAVLSPGTLTSDALTNRSLAAILLLTVGALIVRQKILVQQTEAVYEALRKSEVRYRTIFGQAGAGVAQIDSRTGQFLKVNRKYGEIVDLTEDEMLVTTFMHITHPDDLAEDLASMERLLNGDSSSFTMEKRYVRKDGSIVWVNLNVAPLWQAGEMPSQHIAVVQEITARKQAEETLRELNATLEQRVKERTAALGEANERWDWVVRATNDGVWDWDLLHDTAYFSPRWKEIHGLQDSDPQESAKMWSARIHPEDRHRVLGKIEDYLADKQSRFWEEYRIQRKDGRYIWVLDRGVAIFNDQGRAIRMVGAETDITWRKEAEEALRRQAHEFHALADNVPAFFSYIDRDRRYRFVNKRYEELFGRPNEAIVGLRVNDLLGPDGYAQVEPSLDKALAGEPVSFEYRLSIPGSGERWLSSRYVPDRDEQQQVIGLFVLLADVTALKSSEAMLREREAQLRDLGAQLLRAQEEERRRIARDLHDDVTQRLVALTFELHALRSEVSGFDSGLSSRLQKTGAAAEQLATDLQQMAHGLHPSILEHVGLEAAVREHVDEFAARTGVSAELITRNVPKTIPFDQATCLYRIVQESLQNVRKHANATNVLVRLLRTDRGVGLCVRDDGRGIENAGETARRKGLGLTSMMERVGMLKGTFRIRTKPGDGTEIHAWVPLEDMNRET
jgi:PAS domain S-box-containing protein